MLLYRCFYLLDCTASSSAAAAANDEDSRPPAPLSRRTERRRRTCASLLPVRPLAPAVSQLMEMGFARRKAEAAIKQLSRTHTLSLCMDTGEQMLCDVPPVGGKI